MQYEERIIDTILNVIKDNQTYLTQKKNLPQLAKLGYMYNTLWYGGRCASYDGVIDKKVYAEDDGEKSFIAGANWYKQNYNNWFDYSVTKPPIGVEVLAQSDNWINEDYNIRGIRIGFQNEDENGPFVSAKWDNSGDIYEDCE
jgi:hypothetical protein